MLKGVSKQFFQKIPKKLNVLNIFLVILALGLVIIRFWWLDKFPGGIEHDELEVVLSAKSFWVFGSDISLTKFPISLIANKTDAGLAGLPSFILAAVVGWQKLTLFSVRFPYVILNLITLYFLALLVYKLSLNKFFSISVVFFGLINPWYYMFARSTTEAPFALFFTVLGIYILFNNHGKKIYYSFIPFLLAFFSYFGIKPILALLVPVLLLIHYKFINNTKRSHYLIYFAATLCLFTGYILFSKSTLLGNTLAYRISRESIFSDFVKYSNVVDEQRRVSVEFQYKNLFFNKYTSFSKDVLKKYTGWMTSDFLFFGGDPRAMYRFEDHGMFYIIDVFFLVLGIAGVICIQNKNRKALFGILIILFLLAPIPAAISTNGDSYFFRASMLIPVLIILMAYGNTFVYEHIKSKYKTAYIVAVSLLYSIFFINFLIFFFYRYPAKEFSNQYTDARILANYLNRLSVVDNKSITLVTTSAKAAYYQFLFNTNKLDNKDFELLLPNDIYKIGNLTITQKCVSPNKNSVVVIDSRTDCETQKYTNVVTIQNPKDAGVNYRIFNDPICTNSELASYKTGIVLNDFEIEKMNNNQFCIRWITK
jgi:hypothetical protein